MRDRYAIGIDLGASLTKYGVVSDRGKVVTSGSRNTPVDSGPLGLRAMLQDSALRLLQKSHLRRIKIEGIGIGSPGTVSLKTGQVVGASPNLPGWTGVRLKQIFAKFNLSVWADNDANLMALAEHRLGAARGCRNAVCLTIGTGIGGGIIVEGKLYHGSDCAAGELGHMSINFSGNLCRCGGIGCLEAYVSVPALIEAARSEINLPGSSSSLSRPKRNLSLRHIFRAARMKDKTALKVINNEIDYLSTGLASVVNLLNPEVIVIGGGLVEVDSSFLQEVERKLKQKAFPSATRNLRLVKAKLGNQAGFVGAALACLDYTAAN